MLLAIDTSCDETALTIFDIQRALASNVISEDLIKSEIISSQIKLHALYGGVVPELASREHFKNLPILFKQALQEAQIKEGDITHVAVTRGPGLNGCLLVGLCFAKAFALARKISFLPVHHIEGHIYAAELMGHPLRYPTLALVVSGGHTMLVLLKSFRNYQVIAKTRDDAAGEAFDKSANILGLGYPGGYALSQRAENGDKFAYKFPIGLADADDAFSFSGLKTAVSRKVQELNNKCHSIDSATINDLAASIQHAIVQALVSKTTLAIEKYKPFDCILVGGVAANQYLRDTLNNECQLHNVNFIVPKHRWCTDNASMIAMLATRIVQEDGAIDDTLNQVALVGSMPRWQITNVEV